MKKLPKILSIDEYHKLLAYVKLRKPCRWEQYYLAMVLGFEAGMRLSEILGYKDKVPSLTKDKIDFEANTIRIESGKGSKDRIVPLPKGFKRKHSDMLPLDLSRRALQDFVTKLGLKVLDKRLFFHMFRHGFATHYYNRSKDIVGLQNMLGHSRLDTTQVYTHVNPEEVIRKARELF